MSKVSDKIVTWLINNPTMVKIAENDIAAFLVRIFARILSKSPKDLVIFQVAGSLLALWTGLPMALTYLHQPIPVWLPHWENSTALIAGVLTLALAKIPVDDATILIPKPVGALQTTTDQTTKLDASLQDYATKNNLVLADVQAKYNTDADFKKSVDAAYSITS